MTVTKKYLNELIDEVIKNDKVLSNKIDLYSFKHIYFNKIIKRLKSSNGYELNRDKYQESVNIYFYYSQEKNIYNILALAMIERKLFED